MNPQIDRADLRRPLTVVRSRRALRGDRPLGLRSKLENASSGSDDSRVDRVVPVSEKAMGVDRQTSHDGFGDFDSGGVGPFVELRANTESCTGRRAPDEIHNGFSAHERSPSPVLCDLRKEPMLDLVPLAGSGRKMRDVHAQTRLVREVL